MYPYYRLDGSSRFIILELKKKCRDLNLDNIHFCYNDDKMDFYLKEENNCWGLLVKCESFHSVDYWTIEEDDVFNYNYSEKEQENE